MDSFSPTSTLAQAPGQANPLAMALMQGQQAPGGLAATPGIQPAGLAQGAPTVLPGAQPAQPFGFGTLGQQQPFKTDVWNAIRDFHNDYGRLPPSMTPPGGPTGIMQMNPGGPGGTLAQPQPAVGTIAQPQGMPMQRPPGGPQY